MRSIIAILLLSLCILLCSCENDLPASELDTGTETETEIGTDTETDIETVVGTEAETDILTDTDAGNEQETDADIESDTETDVDSGSTEDSDTVDEPEIDAPETDTPETDEPETDEPETDEPETDAPETDEPETDEPETDEPETDEPETNTPHVHNWSSWKATTAVTCDKDGNESRTCSGCKISESRTVKATGHKWSSWKTTTAVTCDKDGNESRTCSGCKASESRTVKATGHSWSDWYITTFLTCDKDGIESKSCSRCGATETHVTKATGHEWSDWFIDTMPTCVDNGTETRFCWWCMEAEEKSIAATGNHEYESELTVSPAIDREGYYTYKCCYCTDSYTVTIGTYNFDPDDYGDPYHIRTSNNPQHYIDLSINGTTLHIEGKLQIPGLDDLWLIMGNDNSNSLPVSEGKLFSFDVSLANITSKTDISIYLHTEGNATYSGFIWSVLKVENTDGKYKFIHSPVLDNNISKTETWLEPDHCLDNGVTAKIKALSDSIVGGETDDYRKLWLLNSWVAENIYYDYDYFYGITNNVFITPDDVYENKRSVCEGYANLLRALIQAQGIPAAKIVTFSSTPISSSNYLTTSTNHAHVEAYLKNEKRWVVMDPTWDSSNAYQDGEYTTREGNIQFFDATVDYFAFTHKIITRGVQR